MSDPNPLPTARRIGYHPGMFTEDAEIMSRVAALETHWFNALTAANQTAWRARWTTRLPYDIKGRQYTANTPTSLNQVQVTEQRVYAWSQIWGDLRAGLPPVASPAASPSEPTITITSAAAVAPDLEIDFDSSPSGQSNLYLTCYASPPTYADRRAPQWQLRHIQTFYGVATPGEVNIGTRYNARFDFQPGRTVFCRLALINANNELCSLSNILEAVMS
jgi:hypothetical protein